jgi:hypothetical protein
VYLETAALALASTLAQTDIDKMICKDWISSLPTTSSTKVSNFQYESQINDTDNIRDQREKKFKSTINVHDI